MKNIQTILKKDKFLIERVEYLKSREGKVSVIINKAGQKSSSYGIPNSSGQSPTRMLHLLELE